MWTRLLKTNIIYAVGSAANSAALFLLIPYLVNAFSPAEYGAWAIIEVMITFVNMIILLGMDVGLMREYWWLDNEPERRRLCGTVLAAVGLLGLLLFGVLSAPLQFWGHLPFVPSTWQASFSRPTLWLVLGISLVEAGFTLYQAIFRIREEAKIYAALSFGRLMLFLGASIAGVELGGGLDGALAGRLIAGGTSLVLAALLARRYVSLSLDWPRLRRVLSYGLPMLPAGVASYILFASDRYVLQAFSTLETVAVYTFAYKIATGLDILVTRPFATDWAARRFKIATEAHAPQKYAAVLVLYAFVAAGAALLITALTPLAYAWVAPASYQPGARLVPIILSAYLIYGLSYPLNIGIMLKDRTRYLAALSWLAAVACLGLNFWLIPRYAALGAAWATVLAYIVWTAGIAGVSLRLYPIRYPVRLLSVVVLAMIVASLGIWGVDLAGKFSLPGASITKLAWVTAIFSAAGYILWRQRRAWLLPAQATPPEGSWPS